MTLHPKLETAAQFLAERANWLRLETIDRPNGGWDIVLRIDGTYHTESRDQMTDHYQQRLTTILNNEHIRR